MPWAPALAGAPISSFHHSIRSTIVVVPYAPNWSTTIYPCQRGALISPFYQGHQFRHATHAPALAGTPANSKIYIRKIRKSVQIRRFGHPKTRKNRKPQNWNLKTKKTPTIKTNDSVNSRTSKNPSIRNSNIRTFEETKQRNLKIRNNEKQIPVRKCIRHCIRKWHRNQLKVTPKLSRGAD